MRTFEMKNLLLLTLIFSSALLSQTKDQSWKLYNDTKVMEIRITMNPAAFQWMVENPLSDSLHECLVHFKNSVIDTIVDKVGIRVRGNTSRAANKKSFKLSFNDFKAGREFLDVDKMNLNGMHNDPSISRAKFCWDIFQTTGIKASRAAHAALYINNNFMGVYLSTEHIDDEFLKKNYEDDSGDLYKCLFGADLSYKGIDPSVYKYREGFTAYELTTNETSGDYSTLARLINIINTTPARFADSIEAVFHVDQFLKYQAMNVLLGSWDDYWALTNNYYLYYEPAIKKFHWIPYDYDNTFGISWWDINWANGNPYNYPQVVVGKRPLTEKLFAIPEYKNLYTHFLDFYSRKVVNLEQLNSRIDYIKNLIVPYALSDQYRTLDYGFTITDFMNSFTTSSNQHVKTGIKQFIELRSNSISGQLQFVESNPIIYKIDYSPENPGPKDSIYVYVSAFAKDGIDEMKIQFHPGLLTVVYEYNLKFSPVPDTKIVDEADRWVGVIPPLGNLGTGKFQVTVKSKSSRISNYPKNSFIEIEAAGINSASLVINELMAENTSTITDPAGEFEDWIEIYNPTQNEILLTGKYLTDKKDNPSKWQFTEEDLKIKPGEFLIIWCDEDGDKNQAGIHANFKLSADGEFIGIVDSDGKTWIDSVSFGKQSADVSFGRIADASPDWKTQKPTPGKSNLSTGIKENSEIPENFIVASYPNPFNAGTTIQYSLPQNNDVAISIYDILGKEIWSRQLSDQPAGTHRLQWNGINSYGAHAGSGVYILKVAAGNYIATKNYYF
jgi:hypothetical protein